jgi:hypothetical protein
MAKQRVKQDGETNVDEWGNPVHRNLSTPIKADRLRLQEAVNDVPTVM